MNPRKQDSERYPVFVEHTSRDAIVRHLQNQTSCS